MAENPTFTICLMAIFFITRLASTLGKSKPWTGFLPPQIQTLDFARNLHVEPDAIKSVSSDYGNIVHENPAAVLYPSSIEDIRSLIKFSYNNYTPFTVAARGHGHSVGGQAMASNGVVVDMMSLRNHKNGTGITVSKCPSLGFYADVGGEQLWIDVLHSTMEHGFAPVSWTDYLYLSVGGTLSNAGISGTTFRYGPQISNVYEMDVVTGKGELVTCSSHTNSELFYAVLGGLGQFGIITRARIALEPAPKRVKWMRMLYSDFSAFTRDQERLISINGRKQKNALDYLEGSLLMAQGPPNNWRSSFFPSSDIPKIMSLVTQHAIIYCLEVAKYYDEGTRHTVDKDLQQLFKGLSFAAGFKYEKDVSFVDFLNRVRSGEQKLHSQGLWDVPHPWLNLFLPKSRILDFNKGVFHDLVLKRNITTGVVLFYPMNRKKWDDKMSAVIPEEDIFYTVGFLHSSGFNDWQAYDHQNKDILKFCDKAGIEIKQYLPRYSSNKEWINHFGSKWRNFRERKAQFDPKMMLSPGQRIFNDM
ncbi:cytokinin dehydrogenase 3 [Populus alba]|uniref:cytokinin dehydrogenase n=3 Tax=Populus TaxID=3689 RepID=A0A4U5QRB1_POPAL|nr:cytokinin dehydrogenase 3-like [Populus alba]KAJ6993717.1 cytokinin dehydrogenase 3-like [Populus alba x Populus x berolinensis]TKS13510.1 Cytokinin dehydrogenase 3 precursor family protein [Populus alba]